MKARRSSNRYSWYTVPRISLKGDLKQLFQKATAEAKSNMAFIKWTISKLPADNIERAAGDWNGKPCIRYGYSCCSNELRIQKKVTLDFERDLYEYGT